MIEFMDESALKWSSFLVSLRREEMRKVIGYRELIGRESMMMVCCWQLTRSIRNEGIIWTLGFIFYFFCLFLLIYAKLEPASSLYSWIGWTLLSHELCAVAYTDRSVQGNFPWYLLERFTLGSESGWWLWVSGGLQKYEKQVGICALLSSPTFARKNLAAGGIEAIDKWFVTKWLFLRLSNYKIWLKIYNEPTFCPLRVCKSACQPQNSFQLLD